MSSTPEILWWDEGNTTWRLLKELVIPVVTPPNMVNGIIYTIKKTVRRFREISTGSLAMRLQSVA